MARKHLPFCLNLLFSCVVTIVGSGIVAHAQLKVISADNLTPFQPRDVGTTSDAKNVRIKLNYARAISSIAVAPGSTEFTSGAVSGCVVDGHTINPALSACSVDVTFSPKYPGVRTAPLVMTDSAGIKSSVGLVGTGLAPQASLTPGIITNFAGNGNYPGYGGYGTPFASLNFPVDGKFDWAGNLYITDAGNSSVHTIDKNGIVTNVAGNPGFSGFSGIGGPATSATLGFVTGLALDAAGNIYFTNQSTGDYVLKVDLNGILTVFAGIGTSGYSGDGGPATQAKLHSPQGMAADAAGNVYIADYGSGRIRKVDTLGIISTVAGNGENGYSGDGGSATQAELSGPTGVAIDAAGNLYIGDSGNGRIRKVDTNGIITTIAGNGTSGFNGDGPATKTELDNPQGVAVDAAGNVYVADLGNNRIRRIDTNGTIKTIAGDGYFSWYADSSDGDGGPATAAHLAAEGITIDSSGGVYVIDTYNSHIRKVDVSQSAVTFASQNVGITSPSQQVTVANTGNQHVEFTGLSLSGDFQQVTGKPSDCTDTTFLGAGFSCALRITFVPTAAGSLTGSATVTDNSLNLPGTMQTISLSGTGVTL